jgi:hypothetical protein
MIAYNFLHGSGQAGFPHPAPALGKDAYASQGIGMTDGRHRHPASDEAPHAIPKYAAFLAAPRKRAMPKPPYLESKKSQRRIVQGHSVIADVSTHHRLQPLAYFGDGCMHAPLKLGFHLVQLQGCPTSQVRSSSAYVLRLPDASQDNCSLGRTWDLPVPERGVCVRARGL